MKETLEIIYHGSYFSNDLLVITKENLVEILKYPFAQRVNHIK